MGDQVVFTVVYKAGPKGHHPSQAQNKLIPSRGEAVVADSSVSIGTVARLSEPLAVNTEREIRIGFDAEIGDLTNAQLNLDEAIYAGDFTGLINPAHE